MSVTKDRRRIQGERSRQEILQAAEQIATGEGLEALTIGRLASETKMSKAGVFAHFGSKENLQIETAKSAYNRYINEVFLPAAEQAPGVQTLFGVFQNYVAYILKREDIGGCFFTAASMEFDDREGSVKDTIRQQLADRDERIKQIVQDAIRVGEIPAETDAAMVQFSIVAILSGTNVMFQMSKDRSVYRNAELLLRSLLNVPAP